MKPIHFIFLLAAIILLSHSCGSDTEVKREMPDISNIDLDLDLIRYDRALFALDTNDISNSLENLSQKYPEFSDLYFKQITRFYRADKDSFNLIICRRSVIQDLGI